MVAKEKEKLCIQCEGRIPLSAQTCPYCASEQGAGRRSFYSPLFQDQSLQDSLTSLYTPPYQGKHPQFGTIPESHESSFEPEESQAPSSQQEFAFGAPPIYEEAPIYKDVTPPREEELLYQDPSSVEEEVPTQSSLWPSLFLMFGIYLFIIGFMQMAFSQQGVLKMEWNARYWFCYLLLSAPLLFFGWKRLKTLTG